MDLLVGNHIEWYAVEDLQILNRHDPIRPVHSQAPVTPYDFSLSLPDTCNLFEEGVGISSTKVAGEAVLTISTAKTIEVAEVTRVTDGPFPVTQTPFFPMLDKGSSFLDRIFTYMSLLNLVVISARIEYLHKKKKGGKEAQKRKTNTDDLITDEVCTYSFFPLCGASARHRQKDQA